MVRNTLLKINEFNQQQWLIFSVITTTSGIWFSFILNFFGPSLWLLKVDGNGNKSFTLLGLILTILTIAWSLISLIAQRYSEYHIRNMKISSEDFGNTETVYETVNESVVSIIENGIDEKIEYIENLINSTVDLSRPVKKPCNTIRVVTGEITRVLSKLLTSKKHNIHEKDLHIGVFYRFPSDEHSSWHIAKSITPEKGLSLKELEDPKTTMVEAINSESHFAYYNDKQKAKNINHYVPDSEDVIINGKIKGSIACFFFKVRKNDKTYIEFVLSLATYGKYFTDSKNIEDDENIAYNLKNNIFSEFEALLKSALLDLYITHLLDKHCGV